MHTQRAHCVVNVLFLLDQASEQSRVLLDTFQGVIFTSISLAITSSLCTSGAFSSLPGILTGGKRPACYRNLSTRWKKVPLCFPLFRSQGDVTSRKDEENGLAPSKCISLRDAYRRFVERLHPRGLFPLFSRREQPRCGTIQGAILTERNEWASFKVQPHRENGPM